MTIRTELFYETESRLRIRISDPANSRYEVPQKFVERPADGKTSSSGVLNYAINVAQHSSYAIDVTRQGSDDVIIKAIADNLIYADQYLQMSFAESGFSLYGLGEHRTDLMYNLKSGKRVAIWARDQALNTDCNEYGSHPMYVMIENSGKAHGVVLMNRSRDNRSKTTFLTNCKGQLCLQQRYGRHCASRGLWNSYLACDWWNSRLLRSDWSKTE